MAPKRRKPDTSIVRRGLREAMRGSPIEKFVHEKARRVVENIV